jgi:peroxiredoxin
MKNLGLGLFIVLCASQALAVAVGSAAPLFTAQGLDSAQLNLADYKGKYVVLEWHNQGCPYVRKHYDSGNMQKLQQAWSKKGVVWLSVISSAEGKEGYVTNAQEKAYLKEKKADPSNVIFDAKGVVGRLYEAKTTPHMFVIDPAGKLIYNGAIDDKPNTDREDIATAKNYVSAALTEAMAGKEVMESSIAPYGCSVKYE